MTTRTDGWQASRSRVASIPDFAGIRTSISTTCGSTDDAVSGTCVPSSHSPTTWMSSAPLNMPSTPARTRGWSSTIRTRITSGSPVEGVSSVQRWRAAAVLATPTLWCPSVTASDADGRPAAQQSTGTSHATETSCCPFDPPRARGNSRARGLSLPVVIGETLGSVDPGWAARRSRRARVRLRGYRQHDRNAHGRAHQQQLAGRQPEQWPQTPGAHRRDGPLAMPVTHAREQNKRHRFHDDELVIPECPRTLEIRVLIALLLPGAVTS